ncbi:type III-A CRISPR-associated RAMP protein Csm5 [Coleofasciculus sp. E1-EBD-02]|uniref:type III-A CRISPR-associated RAMP protein Csm5 n=1 Tax=Coleofasciculus sp. E1-EBD-02 TaxID=3068481 RepID=UPI0032F315E2
MTHSNSSALTIFNTYKTQTYESKTIELRSPILHIGSEVSQLNPFEYVQVGTTIYLPNPEALAQALLKQGGRFLQDYMATIEKKESIASLIKLAFGDTWQEKLKQLSDVRPLWTQDEGQRISMLRPMIRNGIGQLYIPGSSIKGAIRTAIANYFLNHQVPPEQGVSAIESELRKRLSQGELGNKQQQKFVDDTLFMDNWFGDYSLQHQGKEYNPKYIQNRDILRAVKVSDTSPLVKHTRKNKRGKKVGFNSPVVAEVIVSSHFPDWLAKYKAPLYVEMVRNVRTEFTITLDQEMLSWFRHRQGIEIPFSTIDDLLQICQEFAQQQWDKQVEYWQNLRNNRHREKSLNFDLVWDNFYGKPDCPYTLRLGWGSGLFGTTINHVFAPDVQQQIRDTCGIAAPNFEAPKSRRTVVNSQGDIRYVPGWVKIQKAEG